MAEVREKVLNQEEIECLLDYMKINDDRTDQRPDVRSKHPRWDIDNWPQHIVKKALDLVISYPYAVEEVVFNESIISFRIHADSGDGDLSRLGHSILIPLMVEGEGSTVFFDNYWHGPSTRFSRTPVLPFEYNIPDTQGNIYYTPDLRKLLEIVESGNTPEQLKNVKNLESTIRHLIDARKGNGLSKPDDRTYDYTKIKNFHPEKTLDRSIWEKYLNHVPWENVYGLSIDKIINWVPGDVIVFDRTQIHSAGSGHNRKIGLTLFIQRV